MKIFGRRQSSNVDDRRMGGGGLMAMGGTGIIIALIFTLLTGNPSFLINEGLNSNLNQKYVETPEEKKLAEYVGVVLADTEDVWHEIFRTELNMNYVEPKLVLFKNQVNSACGLATVASGPFYCPTDYSIYIDLAFHKELRDRFKATGDFAMAYVIAHEVGHHVQNLQGILDVINQPKYRQDEKEYNRILKRVELHADYLAGVWAHHQESRNLLDVNDIREALEAAAAVGDDRIQSETLGRVIPDKFTHGTSEQRMRWFYEGYKAGYYFEFEDIIQISENDL